MTFIVQVNDVHTSDRPPRWRRDSYNDDIFAKLEWVVEYANSLNAVVLFCGDLFHTPAPSRVSHELVNRWLDLLRRVEVHSVIIPGNHDLASGRIGSLYRQPLATLGTVDNATILYGGAIYSTPSGERIVGVEWNYEMDAEWVKRQALDKAERGFEVLAIHAAIAKDDNPYYATISPEDLSGISRYVCFGHLHAPEAPYKVDGTTFVNPGALSRGALTASDLKRTPQVAVIDPSTDLVKMIPIKAARPHDQVFALDKAEILQSDNESVDQFVAQMKDILLESVSPETIMEEVRRQTDDPEVVRVAEQIVLSI